MLRSKVITPPPGFAPSLGQRQIGRCPRPAPRDRPDSRGERRRRQLRCQRRGHACRARCRLRQGTAELSGQRVSLVDEAAQALDLNDREHRRFLRCRARSLDPPDGLLREPILPPYAAIGKLTPRMGQWLRNRSILAPFHRVWLRPLVRWLAILPVCEGPVRAMCEPATMRNVRPLCLREPDFRRCADGLRRARSAT